MKAARTMRPSKTVMVGAAGGSPLGVVLVWALALAGVEVPAEVAAAIGSVAGGLIGYLTRGGRGVQP